MIVPRNGNNCITDYWRNCKERRRIVSKKSEEPKYKAGIIQYQELERTLT